VDRVVTAEDSMVEAGEAIMADIMVVIAEDIMAGVITRIIGDFGDFH
jgi:hypothetical protein